MYLLFSFWFVKDTYISCMLLSSYYIVKTVNQFDLFAPLRCSPRGSRGAWVVRSCWGVGCTLGWNIGLESPGNSWKRSLILGLRARVRYLWLLTVLGIDSGRRFSHPRDCHPRTFLRLCSPGSKCRFCYQFLSLWLLPVPSTARYPIFSSAAM